MSNDYFFLQFGATRLLKGTRDIKQYGIQEEPPSSGINLLLFQVGGGGIIRSNFIGNTLM